MNISIFERCRKIIATTLVVTIMSPFFAPTVFAATVSAVDSFGSSDSNDVPGWTDGGGDDSSDSRTSNSDGRSWSSTAHHARIGDGGHITKTVSTVWYENIKLKYYWRGDSDGDWSSDNIEVYWKKSSDSTYLLLNTHQMDGNTSWSSQVTTSLPAAGDNTSIDIRFLGNSNDDNDEEGRIDDVSIEWDVIVVDTTAPIISQVTPVPSPTTDNTPNYTFTTNEAGAITYGGDCSSATTSAVVGSNTITFNTLADGAHSNCTITVTDASSNASNILAVNTFTVDTTGPVITLTGSTPVTVEVGSVYTDAGATASDNIDGDRTANIITVNSVNANVVGSYPVTYDVVDTVGNAATQVTRTVNVVDTTVPVIALLGSATVSVNFGDTYTDAGATASDNYDGDISGSIVTVNPVNTGAIGNYIVTYNVTDANGNAAVQVTRSVDVVDVTAPVIAVTGANPMTIEVGGTYTELGAVASDDVDADFAATPSGSVNTSVLGTYTITYNATDTSGNVATAVTRTVNVVDTTVPVLTLLGITPTSVERTTVYTDAGATANDNLDGDITGSIIVVNPVNTLVIGVYVVTYNVSDTSGNAAVEITRTVNVVDTTAPVISETTPIPTPTSDNTPDYTFTSNEAGTITYGGWCSSATVSASSGANTVTFNTLADGTYSECTIRVTDASSNISNLLTVSTFTVNTAPSEWGGWVGGVVDPTGGVGTPPTPTPEPTPTPTPSPTPNPEPTPTPTPTPELEPTPSNTPEVFFPPIEPLPPEEEAVTPPVNTNTNTGGTTTTGGTGGITTGGTTTTTGGTSTFNPADATLDTGGGGTEEVVPTDETFNPADATLDVGGGAAVVEDNSYTLLWLLMAILALLSGWWFFAGRNKKEADHRRAH